MRITKDEALVLAICLEDYKFELQNLVDSDMFPALEALENKLHKGSKDTRRQGRTTMNSFSDVLKRIRLTHLKSLDDPNII